MSAIDDLLETARAIGEYYLEDPDRLVGHVSAIAALAIVALIFLPR